MPQTIKLKRSAVPGQAPVIGQLDLGELAINTNDGKVYLRKKDGTSDVVIEIRGSIYNTASSVTTSATAPTNPTPAEGDLWYDTVNDRLMMYDGTDWKEVAHTLSDLTVTGDTILGDDAAADTLVVNAQAKFTGTDGLVIPAGTTADRVTADTGTIRYNTDTSSFEGYSGTAWGSLGGVKDVDQDTYIQTESSAGADEDTFQFYAGGSNIGSWSGTNLTVGTNLAIADGQSFTFGQGANRIAFTDTTRMTVSNEAGTIIFDGRIFTP